MELFLHHVSEAHAPKIDRSAVWTVYGTHSLLSPIHTSRGLNASLDSTPARGRLMISERWERVMYIRSAPTASGAACFPGGLNLFRRPHVGLGEPDLVLRPGNLPLVSLL
jgi:hypothetical protein